MIKRPGVLKKVGHQEITKLEITLLIKPGENDPVMKTVKLYGVVLERNTLKRRAPESSLKK